MTANIRRAPEEVDKSVEVDAYMRRLHEQVDRALSLATGISQELRAVIENIDDPLRLAYLIAGLLDMPVEDLVREDRRLGRVARHQPSSPA